jgi:acetyl-CoA C-acetyltransferase
VDPQRTPVIVSAAQVVDRERELGALELLVRAAAGALDASNRLAASVERVSVVNILTRSGGPSPARDLCAELHLSPASSEVTTVGGSSPQWLVQRAAEEIAAGRLSCCLIAGAEAVRSGRIRPPRTEEAAPPPPREDPVEPEPLVGDERPGSSAEEIAAGLAIPAVVYPLFENVLARRAGRSHEQQRRHIGQFLAPFTAVAAKKAGAWFPVERSADELATPSAENRLVAEPYTKLMTAFLGGSQAAAIAVTSLAVARRLDLDDGAVFVRSSATAEDVWFPSARPDLGTSPAIAAAGRAALDAGSLGLDEIDFVDLYSCFPSAVQLGAEALGLRLDDKRGLTVTGGLPYFGGPGSNYATHSIATMFELLRERGGHGLVTALGWYATKHAAGCYSATPPPGGFRVGDTSDEQAAIDASALPVVPLQEDVGVTTALVEAGTVVYGRDGEVIGAPVVATLADGRRVVAAAEPADLPSLAGADLGGTTIELRGRPPRYRVS